MLTVIPQGGLCNRLRVIDSGVGLARELGLTLRVIWQANAECNCRFSRLFELVPGISIVEVRGKLPIFWAQALRRPRLARRLAGARVFEHAALLGTAAQQQLVDRAIASKAIIRTFETFFQTNKPLSWLTATPEILEKVEATVAEFGPHMVGVHARRTDNEDSIRFGPTSEFVRLMRECVSVDPTVKFFLATDGVETEAELRAEFGDRILVRAKKLSRNDPQGIVDALVDVYCLSRTSRIIGSYWSTFSITASQLGRIPLTTVKVSPAANALR
jgi:hypothetical protein